MTKRILIALGGNALSQKGERGTAEEQLAHVHETCKHLIGIMEEGYEIAVTHGNGPQVGEILLQNEMTKDKLPPMPLDICGAESQGMIGYMIQRSLDNRLRRAGKTMPVVTVFTQTLVDANDPAFKNPSKPIGAFYTKEQADKLMSEKGWKMVEQTGKGFRRVVPSPEPIEIIEGAAIKRLCDEGMIVIACGGGGVPVIAKSDGALKGVEAVIDKDHTASVFAKTIGANVLLILTDTEHVTLNFGKANQKELDKLTVADAKKYLAEGQFPKGSMGPKVESAVRFVEAGGERAIITSLEKGKDALDEKAGTTICA
ncbi:MAG: carbamate kinase [Pseudomonadota bacterium]